MSSATPYTCSEKEGSVVNLDLEDAVSWSFHFMIYKRSKLGTMTFDHYCHAYDGCNP
jgi:hypothetical protein